MATKWSAEPWRVESNGNLVMAEKATRVCLMESTWARAGELEFANAERAVLCVNACKGWTNEQLGNMVYAARPRPD